MEFITNVLALVVLLGVFGIWWFIKKQPNRQFRNTSIIITLVAFVLFGIINPSDDPESKATSDSSEVTKQVEISEDSSTQTSTEQIDKVQESSKFVISQDKFDEAVEQVKDTLKYETLYEDSQFVLKDDSIVFAIQVNAATNKDKAKDIADTAVRQLSAWLSYSYDELTNPSADDFGNLPDYYEIKLGVGSDENNMIITKVIASYNNNGKI